MDLSRRRDPSNSRSGRDLPGGHAALPAESVALHSLWRGHRLPSMDLPRAHRPGDLLIRLPLIPAISFRGGSSRAVCTAGAGDVLLDEDPGHDNLSGSCQCSV